MFPAYLISKSSINRIDDTSVNYYKTTAVPFADKGKTL